MPLLIILGFFAVASIVARWQIWRIKRDLRRKLHEDYGKPPEKGRAKPEVAALHWMLTADRWPDDEKIDEITWNDLDMDRIYDRINVSRSYIGDQMLYARLHRLPRAQEEREAFHRKVVHFDAHPEERVGIQMVFESVGREGYTYDFTHFIHHAEMNRLPKIWSYRILQTALILSVVMSIILRVPMAFLATGAIFAVNLTLYTVSKMRYETNLDMLKCITGIVDAGKRIANQDQFLYETIFGDLEMLTTPFIKMSNIIALINLKKEMAGTGDVLGLFYDYVIGATLWDFIKYDQAMKVLGEQREPFLQLFERLGEIESAICVASYRAGLPHYCIPTFGEDLALDMDAAYHPLITAPVGNAAYLGKGTLITGSNASGKSTFIKAVALNVILGQSLGTCTASRADLPDARVITSMAVRDDLSSGESYYIKEIKYLKRILDSLSSSRVSLCIIDEILRGTNTTERLAASEAVLRYLQEERCLVIVASHDIELTHRLGSLYDNYHFTEVLKEGDVSFDYTIYPGASYSKNAIRLLDLVGFPGDLVEEARKLSR